MFFDPSYRSETGFVPNALKFYFNRSMTEQEMTLKDRRAILTERAMLLQIQFSVSLLLSAMLTAFVLARESLRKGLCSSIFVNHEILHIFFSIVAIAMESIPELMYEHNIVYNSFFIAIFISLLLMSGERLLKIKLPFLHERIGKRHKLMVMSMSWSVPLMFFGVTMVIRISPSYLIAVRVAIFTIGEMLVLVANVIVYHAVLVHDKFVRTNAHSIAVGRGMFKASIICFSLVLSFVMLWSPILVHDVLLLCGKNVGYTFARVAEHTALMNPIVDGIFYLCLYRKAQCELKYVLNCCGN